MTSRFELWDNLHRAMMPLAHWYAIIDNQVILELQNKVIHEVLHNRYCLIKWAPMHEQVTLLRKLLSHIFERYAEVQDNGYISDEDIERCPEIFMSRLRIMPIRFQEPALLQQLDTPHKSPHRKTEQSIEQDLHHIRRVLFLPETEPEDEPMPLDNISLEDKNVYIPNDSPDWFEEPSPDRHLCIHDEHQDGSEHLRLPPRPDSIVPYGPNDSPSGFMSLQDIEDMNMLVDVDCSSDDELPDLI